MWVDTDSRNFERRPHTATDIRPFTAIELGGSPVDFVNLRCELHATFGFNPFNFRNLYETPPPQNDRGDASFANRPTHTFHVPAPPAGNLAWTEKNLTIRFCFATIRRSRRLSVSHFRFLHNRPPISVRLLSCHSTPLKALAMGHPVDHRFPKLRQIPQNGAW
jgi:hypothetical protein